VCARELLRLLLLLLLLLLLFLRLLQSVSASSIATLLCFCLYFFYGIVCFQHSMTTLMLRHAAFRKSFFLLALLACFPLGYI
jgi:uncharacterized membrane protein